MRFKGIWKARVPPSVKVFSIMLLKGKIPTHDMLRARGIHCEMPCPMCSNCPCESVLHLIFLCPFAVEVWFE